MTRKILFCFALALSLGAIRTSVVAQEAEQPRPVRADRTPRSIAAVRTVLDAQVAAWNRGDIEGFMKGYRRSSDTVFISGDSVTRGWQTVLDRYKKAYDSREKMGTLKFSELEIRLISQTTAVALGRWELVRVKDNPRGRFTLLLRRTQNGWRIVHDHTSSA